MGVSQHLRWSFVAALLCIGDAAYAAPPVATGDPAPTPAAAAAAPATPAPAAPTPAAPTPAAATAASPAPTPAAPAPGAASTPASAAPAAKPKLSPAAALRAASQALASASPSEARQGLLALAELSGDAPARVLADRLRAGLPPALIGDAIDVAVQLGSPRAVPALSELMQHKRPAVRKHAISALAALKAKTAQSALLAALDDPDREVRRAAVDALAELKVTRALPQLLALVERGQPGALQAVGKLAGARELGALVAQAPSGDVTPLKPALQIWLADDRRPPAQQLELIAAMTRVASPSARAYLVEWLDAAKSASNPRVRTALFVAIKQLDQSDDVTRKNTRTVVQGAEVSTEAPSNTPGPAQTKSDAAPRKGAGPTASLAGRERRRTPPVANELARAEAPKPAAGTAVSTSVAGGAR